MSADTTPFGIFEKLPLVETTPRVLARGDIFAVISDGIFEATDSRGEEFGRARVVELLKEHHDSSADEILEELKSRLLGFTGGRPSDDDRTVVLIKRTRP